MVKIEESFNKLIKKANISIQKLIPLFKKFQSKVDSFKEEFYNNSSEFSKRTVSSILLVLIYFIVIVVGGGLFSSVILIVSGISIYEIYCLAESIKDKVERKKYMKNAIIAISIITCSLILLRFSQKGGRLTLWLFTIIGVTDITAYLIGKWIGKVKILPNISPNKTIEGTIGGIVCGVTSSLLCYLVLHNYGNSTIKFIYFVFTTIAITVSAQIGDALQSVVKRRFGVKDMGNIIPGHGGVSDRLDSLIVAAPVALLLSKIIGGNLF